MAQGCGGSLQLRAEQRPGDRQPLEDLTEQTLRLLQLTRRRHWVAPPCLLIGRGRLGEVSEELAHRREAQRGILVQRTSQRLFDVRKLADSVFAEREGPLVRDLTLHLAFFKHEVVRVRAGDHEIKQRRDGVLLARRGRELCEVCPRELGLHEQVDAAAPGADRRAVLNGNLRGEAKSISVTLLSPSTTTLRG